MLILNRLPTGKGSHDPWQRQPQYSHYTPRTSLGDWFGARSRFKTPETI